MVLRSVQELKPSKEFFIEEYVKKRRSALSIAKELGVGETTVFRWLESYGIKRRTSYENQHPLNFKEPTKEELYDLHHNQHKSLNEIARIYRVSWETVKRWFKKYGIRNKSISEISLPKGFVRPSKEELVELLDKCLDTKKIGGMYKVNRTTVVKWLHSDNIPLSKIKRNRKPYNKYWTKEKIIDEITNIKRNNGNLSAKFCLVNNKSLYGAGSKYFGSWANAIVAAGFDYYGEIAISKNKYWTKDKITGKIKEIHKSEGNLSSRYIRMKHSDLYDAAKVKFSSWKEALSVAGFNYEDFNKKYKYLSKDGTRVMSLYEMDVANWLYFHGIDYEYEPKYPKNMYYKRGFIADFKVGKFIIEVLGRLDDPDYVKNFDRKSDQFMMVGGTGSAVFKGEEYDLYKPYIDKENKDVIVVVMPKNKSLSKKEITRQLGFLIPIYSKNQKIL